MCIIKKVFYYEEIKLPVVKYKDEIWVKAMTVANILRYKNTIKSIRDYVDPERRPSELGPKSKQNEIYIKNLYQRVRIIQSNTSL